MGDWSLQSPSSPVDSEKFSPWPEFPGRKEGSTMAVSKSSADSQKASTTIRRATQADAEASGKICFDAFGTLNARHGFPTDFPGPEAPIGLLTWMFSHPSFFCVVAERGGKIIGSNCLDERTPIAGVGPVTVDPGVQNGRVGRQLMDAVIARSAERNVAGIRLVQTAFHNRSLALYAKLGFAIREPLACLEGPPLQKILPGYQVRPATPEDVATCNDLCRRIHGHERGGELADGIAQGIAVVAERGGVIKAYGSGVGFFHHAVGEETSDLIALISAAEEFAGPGFLVPMRNSELLRWCLGNGLRVRQMMTLMTMGLYNEPAGAYLPSVLY